MQLDDDYFNLCYTVKENLDYVSSSTASMIMDADKIISFLLGFYKDIGCASLAMAQGGDFIGGEGSGIFQSLGKRRKAMNTFVCSTLREFRFIGRVNEDVNTYTSLQNKGIVFLTIPLISIQQKLTQNNKGGMTEMYLDSGTYIKSFYTIMYSPSSVKIETMGETHRRLHHKINWECTAPQIISEQWRKS